MAPRESEDTARAKGAVSIWRAPIEEFRRLLQQHPDTSWEFVATLARRQRQMERRLEGFAFKRVEARLAETFRELSGGFAMRCEHGFGQHLRLSQQELADLVGASRPVVSTILNRLRDQGVLGYNREYVCVRRIEDIENLIDSCTSRDCHVANSQRPGGLFQWRPRIQVGCIRSKP